MTTHGPFHSLTDTDKQALTDQLHQGVSVLRAARALGLNYVHALNYAHRWRARSSYPGTSTVRPLRTWPVDGSWCEKLWI